MGKYTIKCILLSIIFLSKSIAMKNSVTKNINISSSSLSSSRTDSIRFFSFFLSCHPSVSSITPGRSTKQHPVPTQSWSKYVPTGQPTLAHPCVVYICLYLPSDRTWHKVNDLKVDYSGDLGEGKVGHEPRLKPCWTMLIIGPLSAMWAWWAKLDSDLNLGPGTYTWL